MSNILNITIPDELKNAPKDIQEEYINWHKIGEELDNHPERYYEIPDKHGDSIKVDCKGVWAMNVKRIKKLGVYTKDYEKEIKRRSKILAEIKLRKGHCAARYNGYLNTNKIGKNVLDFRKGDILEAFGEYKSITQTLKLIKEWGFNIDKQKLTDFYYANLDEIQDRRVRFQSKENDYYLATATGRIEGLTHLYNKLLELFENTNNVRYASEIRSIIEQVRKEVKGDEIRFTADLKIDITATVQANKTVQELNQRIPINMFIISLVASKKGIEPSSIMSQLGNSFYADYNGFNPIQEEEQMKLPSHLINSYDWNEIEKMHREKEERATNKVFDNEMDKLFKKHNIVYRGNPNNSLQELKAKLSGETTTEIVDVEVLETEVIEEKKEVVEDKRQKLKELLKNKKEKLK